MPIDVSGSEGQNIISESGSAGTSPITLISGSTTIKLQSPANKATALTIGTSDNTYVTINDHPAVNYWIFWNKVMVYDDIKLTFGASGEDDSYIEYRSAIDRLVISGSDAGIEITGSTLFANDVQIAGNLYGSSPLQISGGCDLGGDLILGTDCNNTVTVSGNLTALCDFSASQNISASAFYGDGANLTNLPGGGGGGDAHATYVVLSTTGSLSAERVLTAGDAIALVDDGAGSTLTVSGVAAHTDTAIQFNSGSKSKFSGSSNLTFDYYSDTLNLTGTYGGTAVFNVADYVSGAFVVSGNVGNTDYGYPNNGLYFGIDTTIHTVRLPAGATVDYPKNINFGTGTLISNPESGQANASVGYDGDKLQISGSENGVNISGSIYAWGINSGTIAGLSSYIGLDSDSKLVLTASSGDGGGGSPGGSADSVQVNDGGGGFTGDSYFTYNTSAGRATLTGTLIQSGGLATFYENVQIYGTLYGGSPLEVSGGLNCSGSWVVSGTCVVSGTLEVSGNTIHNYGNFYNYSPGPTGTFSIESMSSSNGWMADIYATGALTQTGSNSTFHTPDQTAGAFVISGSANTDQGDPEEGLYFGVNTAIKNVRLPAGAIININKKLWFGTGSIISNPESGTGDASISYNNGENSLIIESTSGSTNGINLSGSITARQIASGTIAGPGSYVGVAEDGLLVLTASAGGGGGGTPGGSDTQIQFNDGGSFGGQANLTYEKTQSTLFVSASQSIFSGSTIITGSAAVGTAPSYDGQGGDGIALKVEGGGASSDQGKPVLVCQVTGTQNSGDVGYVGIGTAAPKVQLDIRWNPDLDPNTGGGDVVSFATGTTSPGALYYLNDGGGWVSASAANTGSGNDQLLGIALGNDAQQDGMLIRGWADVSNFYQDTFKAGQAVYIASASYSGSEGRMSGSAPTADNSYSRIVGYASPNASTIYFNPGTSWIELTGSG